MCKHENKQKLISVLFFSNGNKIQISQKIKINKIAIILLTILFFFHLNVCYTRKYYESRYKLGQTQNFS